MNYISNRVIKAIVSAGCLLAVVACGEAPAPVDLNDPYETRNRKVHAFNKSVDTAVVRPLSVAYVNSVPSDIQDSVDHFATNFGQPANAVNALLQGDLRGVGLATSRFLINTGLGFGGLFDVASDFDVPDYDTDFGETLHVWGAGEGAYLEVPFQGPSTVRDQVGFFADFLTNPLGYMLPTAGSRLGTVSNVASGLGTRGNLADTIDGVLYESADSYAQSRLIYLQNRRFELGQAAPISEQIDPFSLDTEGF